MNERRMTAAWCVQLPGNKVSEHVCNPCGAIGKSASCGWCSCVPGRPAGAAKTPGIHSHCCPPQLRDTKRQLLYIYFSPRID